MNNIIKTRTQAHLLAGVMSTLIATSAQAGEAGFDLERLHDQSRDRPIAIDWWYPTNSTGSTTYNYGMGSGRVEERAPIANGVFPLVVLSHGALGAARNYSWIAEHLARNGHVVAGISHYGESYIYGPQTVDPAAVLQAWRRPADISAALDHITQNKSTFSKSVDPSRISFVGHSSGGATGLFLAGLRFNSEKMRKYCNSPISEFDRGCDYARDVEPQLSGEPLAAKDYTDPRIRRFVLLDPALVPGFEGYSALAHPENMLIIGSTQNDFLPFEAYGKVLTEQLPLAQTIWLTEGEGHFVYLNTCEANVEANGVSLCQDRPGVDRSAVHIRLQSEILGFLQGIENLL